MPFIMVKGFLTSVLLLAVYSNASVLDQPVDKLEGYEEAGSENIVQDFDKGLKVTKVVESNGEQKCLLEILDETTRSTNVKKSFEKPENTIHEWKSVNLTTQVSDNLVEDRSFLSETAAALCVDAPIYLTFQSSDESTDVEPARRSKRQASACCNDERLWDRGYEYENYETDGCIKICIWRHRTRHTELKRRLSYFSGRRFKKCGDMRYVCEECGGTRECPEAEGDLVHGRY